MRANVMPLVAALGLALGGCANLTSVHHRDTFLLDRPHVVSVDAKERAIISTVTEDGRLMTCSEPPPDALSALSVSSSADLGVKGLKSADPEVQLRAALAMSETAATIERTQTVNLLRESMYRTCERYLSGALSKEEFIVQSARDQRAMVQVLAIEQLTRTVRAPSTVIGAGAAGATLSDPAGLLDAVKQADADEATTAQTLSDANGAVTAQEQKAPASESGVTCAAATADKPGTDKQAYYDACQPLLKAQQTAKANHDAAVVRQTDFHNKSAALALTATAGTGAFYDAGGSTTPIPPDPNVAIVAEAVKYIVQQNEAFPELDMTCVVRLRNYHTLVERASRSSAFAEVKSKEDKFDDACVSLVEAEVQSKTLVLTEQNKAAVAADVIRDKYLLAAQVAALRIYLSSGSAHDKWDALLDKSGVLARRGDAASLKAPTDVNGAVGAFGHLDFDQREQVISEIGAS